MDTYIRIKKYILILVAFCLGLSFAFAETPNLKADTQTFSKAKVIKIISEKKTEDIASGKEVPVQEIEVEILDGEKTGRIISFTNDYQQLKAGEEFYARHYVSGDGDYESWSVSDKYRLDSLLYLSLVFVFLLFTFGGIQGVRGLASLIGSLVLIFYVLVPGIYAGYNAIFISIAVSALIIILGSYITHGFNLTTSCAVLGMISTVLLTGIGAYYSVELSGLSGFSSEENTYLHYDTAGKIDMLGLLFGGIMIGLLGVLYDMAIGQAVSIEELYRANKNQTVGEVYKRGLRIGREHIGALVNTLAIAYVGASLPLILLIQSSTVGLLFILNSEIFATEIIRILIGSIGLVLAVPITTLIASYLLHDRVSASSSHGHTHSHHH